MIRLAFTVTIFTLWYQMQLSAADKTRLAVEVLQDDADVSVCCELDTKRLVIGQPLRFRVTIQNCGKEEVRVFDPMHDLHLTAKMISMRVTRLEILDEGKELIGDLFAKEGGSDFPRLERFWISLPPDGLCESEIRCYHVGYVPRTHFIKNRELSPGTYYLRLVVTSDFLLSNFRKDPASPKRLVESDLLKIELVTP